MSDIKNFEAEVIENCGQEFLDSIGREVVSKRRGVLAERGCMTLCYIILAAFFFVLPGMVVSRHLITFYGLSGSPIIEATVLKLEFDDIAEVLYGFGLDEGNFFGKSELMRTLAAPIKKGSTISVFYDADQPSRNRAVAEMHPLRRDAPLVLALVVFGLFSLHRVWRFLTDKRKGRQSILPWLEYVAHASKPSPRAWVRHGTGPLKNSPGVRAGAAGQKFAVRT